MSSVRAEDEIEWTAHAHGNPCRRASKGEANASPLSRLWAGDFSPLDRRLQLIEQLSWSPGTIAQALRLGSEIPFARAAKQFQEMTHVTLSKNSLQRLAKAYGGRLVGQQAEEAQATVQIPSKETEAVWRETVEPASEVMNISMDGAMVNIRGEGWKEVKLVTVSAVRHLLDAMTGKTYRPFERP